MCAGSGCAEDRRGSVLLSVGGKLASTSMEESENIQFKLNQQIYMLVVFSPSPDNIKGNTTLLNDCTNYIKFDLLSCKHFNLVGSTVWY